MVAGQPSLNVCIAQEQEKFCFEVCSDTLKERDPPSLIGNNVRLTGKLKREIGKKKKIGILNNLISSVTKSPFVKEYLKF